MSQPSFSITRRALLATAAATGAVSLLPAASKAKSGSAAIRPFKIEVPQADIDDLLRRLASTRWPDRETVEGQTQGVQLATLQPLVQYWATDYDWRKAEAKLNALPQFITEIDGLDIQFAHIRSEHPNAMPLILTHGWPGSIFELLKVVEPLTNPTAHGGREEDAFHLVLPTYPGYGFSGKPKNGDWAPPHVAKAWHELMLRLGYKTYVAQGGDWGAIISELMAIQAPTGLLGVHTNMPGTVPPEIVQLVRMRQPAPDSLSHDEKAAFKSLDVFYNQGFGYAEMMNTRPQTLGYSLADSPVGMAGFYYEKFATWSYTDGHPEKAFTKDEILDAITLYWLTNTGTSSSRSYWDAAQLGGGPFTRRTIKKVPVAVTVFPGEIYQAPKGWTEQSYENLIYFNKVDKGGHFAAWEEPELFAKELRSAFKSLR
ncbi:epoxide hydrolase N-terminal domain-containing protein [Ensifer sp. ENS04]|uniref:epoxide hydrolase family protein n=1 Tax=Ensifer sp. ENS04 TaxID=2769281 RepID=UPI00177E2CE8|nr:epoxide hydrolase [Ensifer sp. ENS04]MBD9541373.1 epoxide hydrolase N-terminal domain-containing protein [Ensifer sp. ENS04]